MILRVVVFYGLTAFFLFVIGGVQQEVGLPADLLFLFQWAPGIAGLLTMLIFRRRDGVRITFVDPEMPLRRYLWAFLLPLAPGLLAFVFTLLFLGDPQGMQLTIAAVSTIVIGAVGEEIGWRGYLHKRIAPHMKGLLSSLLVGLLWTPFHTTYFEGGILFMVFFGLVMISMSMIAYAALAEYRFNVLGATVFHLAINLTSVLVAGLVQESFSLPYMMTYGVISALVAAAVVYLRRDLFVSKLAAAQAAPSQAA